MISLPAPLQAALGWIAPKVTPERAFRWGLCGMLGVLGVILIARGREEGDAAKMLKGAAMALLALLLV